MEGVASQDEAQLQSDGGEQKNREPVEDQPDEWRCFLLGPRNNSYCDGLYDRPPLCFGCGIGWFCFILGFAFPPFWYLATVLHLCYIRDPRERAGLAASAIAALICTVAALITLLAVIL